MSKKDHYIQQVRHARIEHKKWINQIRIIVSGLEKNRDAIALNPSESAFGEWFYSQAMTYSISNSKLVLTDIELLFDECYQEYHKIYAVLFKEESSGLLNSLFGSKKASPSDYKIAGQYYEKLIEKSDKLLNKLRIFENQLTATNIEKFNRALENTDYEEKVVVQTPKHKELRYYRGSLIED